jgi:peroxidase
MYYTPDNRTLLPPSVDPTDGCNEKNMNAQGKYCFSTGYCSLYEMIVSTKPDFQSYILGDKRANENLLLTSMHLIFARHHNFLAENLEMVNPHWTDEQLFLEARAILGAQMQHIHYDEFLSVLLGKEMTEKMGILSQPKTKDSLKDMYDPSIDPTIANNFAAGKL